MKRRWEGDLQDARCCFFQSLTFDVVNDGEWGLDCCASGQRGRIVMGEGTVSV